MLQIIKDSYNRILNFMWSDKTPISRRWPIIFWFGTIFCFILFPAFLIDVGLDSYLTTRKGQQKKDIFKQLNSRLELLIQYGNSRHYYHAVLQKIIELAEKSPDPMAYLQKALPHLKKVNPGIFRFIVWDKKGRTVDKLTDEKSYKYIVKTLYEVFVQISEDCFNHYPGNPSDNKVIDKKINLMRSYLGAFFIPERLNLPFLRGILGECIMASSVPEKSHFWFQIRKDFGLFANIDLSAIESSAYLKKLVKSMNTSATGIKCGTAELIKDRKVFTDRDIKFKRELLIELGKFGQTSETEVESNNLMIAIKPITPFTLGFCLIPSKNILINSASARTNILIAAVAFFLSLGALVGFFIFRSGFFSIRWKLALLFIYANGLPLMILGFLGFEYLQQTKTQLLDQAQKQISSLLNDMDSKYINILDKYASMVNNAGDKVNQAYEKGLDAEPAFKNFTDETLKLFPNDLIIVDQFEKFKYFKCSGGRADKFISNMAKNLILYVNESKFTPFKMFDKNASNGDDGKIKAQAMMSDKSIVFDRILHKTRKIEAQQMASEERMYYWAYLGDMKAREIKYLTMISWSHDTLQEEFLKEFLDEYNRNSDQIKIYAMIETNGITYPQSGIAPEIQKMFRQVFNLKIFRSDAVTVNDRNFTAWGSVGKLMNRIALIGIYPLEKIENHLSGIRLRLIIFAFLSLSLTSGIGFMLARQFLEPVKELENGVKAIGEQNFRYRIPIESADEFGHLGNVFNRAIESLEDLEVAKIVQDNLFPAEPLKQGRLEVFGKSVSMTRLGGDYYDYYPIDDKYAGVLMGDVAGHGVPAALLMAMAKASVLIADDQEKHSPAMLLSTLHKVIFKVKSSKIKRMMTCQYFSINTETGEFKFSNAGHCFPALIKKGTHEIELIKHIGTPLGITKRARYQDDSLQLESDDILLLYTDGIIETKNKDGIEMGFENFKRLISESRDDDLEKFYQNLFKAYLDWSPSAEDDITMVLIKFKAGNEGTTA